MNPLLSRSRSLRSLPFATVGLLALTACGARSGLRVPERDVVQVDEGPDVAACMPRGDQCGMAEICGNGTDDNCNGAADEGCNCTPGSVQGCFTGPPGRRNVGICRDGQQVCTMAGTWGECRNQILPGEDVCNQADNLCNGCSARARCPIQCPGPDDARIPNGHTFQPYALRGGDFFPGRALRWRWSVRGGPCDDVLRRPSFRLSNSDSMDATLLPTLSGEYEITLTVLAEDERELTCRWVVHVEGPGVRVEMCYPEADREDLDLYVHSPFNQTNWFPEGSTNVYWPTDDTCAWHNCEAHLRGRGRGFPPEPTTRADWGYAPSPLSECENGPFGLEWRGIGFCANPRLDVDNNLSEGTGLPENTNIDTPVDGHTWRVLVQNFTGGLTHPMVNIYCGGRRTATFGAAPDIVTGFRGRPGRDSLGIMWRVADVTAHVAPDGRTTGCTVVGLRDRDTGVGYDVRGLDPTY